MSMRPHVDGSSWEEPHHVAYPDEVLLSALGRLGHPSFRPGQRAIVESVLTGKETVAIMPTGGGKSLCFQLPALLLPGVTVVVSPLIALMRDQVGGLVQRGLPATFINSALSQSEREDRQQNLSRYRLVYVAPERFRSPRFCEALRRVPLQLLAIDEAHCISEWGHDFRPDYRRLGEVVAELRPARCLALTATATPEVRRDIVEQLGFSGPRIFVHGFDRDNLDLQVERTGGDKDKFSHLVRHLCSTQSGVAIVYTSTRKKATQVAESLTGMQFLARPYHAGLSDEERRDTEKAFLSGELPVIVATNAFGMGIDKRDVRLVIHHDLPRSPEAYYQEAGRAGRDGKDARCVLLFNPADVKVQEFLIEQSVPEPSFIQQVYRQIESLGPVSEDALQNGFPKQSGMMVDAALRALSQGKAIADDEGLGYRVVGPLKWDQAALLQRMNLEKQKLKRMMGYGYHAGCRMRYFLDYFGDHFRNPDGTEASKVRCERCDNCKEARSKPLNEEEHLTVRKALSGVARLHGRYGRRRIAEMLHGVKTDEAERLGLTRLSTFGLLSDFPLAWVMDLLVAMEAAGLVVSSGGDYPTLGLSDLGKQVMHDRAKTELLMPKRAVGLPKKAAQPKSAKASAGPTIHRQVVTSGALRLREEGGQQNQPETQDVPLTQAQDEIFDKLRSLRMRLAKQAGVKPFFVFHDRTLREIAKSLPRTLSELGKVPGIGPAKLQSYGEAVLRVLLKEGA